MNRRCNHAVYSQTAFQELVNIAKALGGTWNAYVAMCQSPAHAAAIQAFPSAKGTDPFWSHVLRTAHVTTCCGSMAVSGQGNAMLMQHASSPAVRRTSSAFGIRQSRSPVASRSTILRIIICFRRRQISAFIEAAPMSRAQRPYSCRRLSLLSGKQGSSPRSNRHSSSPTAPVISAK